MHEDAKLHIISFDIPLPANYGGVIDVYHKLEAMHKAGCRIILHCFQYGDRKPEEPLNQICEEVHYYPRKQGLQGLSLSLPYIVQSRTSGKLLDRLSLDHHPILFEGLHCCAYLGHHALQHKHQYVRMHNIEWQYYQQLGKRESNLLKAQYFQMEARALRKFEANLHSADDIFAISTKDQQYLQETYDQSSHIPPFHPFDIPTGKPGKGEYMLYHGNLAVNENQEAARFLLEQVQEQVELPLVIAGGNPDSNLVDLCKKESVKLIINPPDEQLCKLIANAQLNVLPTFQDTGIKLKLLSALYQGRFCLVNTPMITSTGLESLCIKADGPEAFISKIKHITSIRYTQQEQAKRHKLLQELFSNASSARAIMKRINFQRKNIDANTS